MKKGISLVVLVITIIVLIILTCTVIYNIVNENGIIYKAQEAQFKNDLKTFNEELGLYKINHVEEIKNEKINKQGYDQIKIIIGSFDKKYSSKVKILDNELVLIDTGNNKEIKWATEIGIRVLYDKVFINFEMEGAGSIKCTKKNGTLIDTSIQNSLELTDQIIMEASAQSKKIGDTNVNYTFDGWYKNGKLISKETTYTETITEQAIYTACFIPNYYTLIYFLDENNNLQVELNNSTKLTGYSSRMDITKLEIGSNVTSIDNNAFNGCKNLQLTSLPSSLISIGQNAFAYCEKITVNEIPSGCYLGTWAFKGCTGITNMNIPNSTYDGYYSGVQFQECTGLKEITLGSVGHPITKNLYGILFQCPQENLTIKIYIENGKTNLEGEPWCATNATVEYYNSDSGELVNVIMGLKYKGNTEINWTQLPNSEKITKIKDNAFNGCKNLQLTSLPSSLISIGQNAFAYCEKITVNEIPSGCYLGTWAFKGCTGITNMNIPNSTYDGYYSGVQFQECTNLKKITLGSVGHPITKNLYGILFKCLQKDLTIKIYIENGKTNLEGEPWYATNATIEYYNSETGEKIN